MSKSLNYIKKRRSPKKYISNYRINESERDEILESIRWAPSSVGLEPYRILFIENKKLREEMKPWCWNQPGTVDSSAMILWIGFRTEKMINEVIPTQNKRNVPDGFEKAREYRVNAYNKVISGFEISNDEFVARQAYISMGCALVTAEEIGIDFCPIEGFEPKKIEEILQNHGLIDLESEFVCVGAFVGKVDKEQKHHFAFEKIRRPREQVYKLIK